MPTRHPEQTATSLLLRQRLRSLRFDPTSLKHEPFIRFDTIQHYCATTRSVARELTGGISGDGFTVTVPRPAGVVHLVLYNADIPLTRRRFTLAHELGHIYLGHEDDADEQEREADRFAAQLLMPRILVDQLVRLWGKNLPAEELAAVFGVSHAAAKNRLRGRRSDTGYDEDELRLLARCAALLPSPEEPLITVT